MVDSIEDDEKERYLKYWSDKDPEAMAEYQAFMENIDPGTSSKDTNEGEVDGYESPKDRIQHEKLKVEYRRTMEKPYAEDPVLKNFLDQLYRPGARIGSGSTASAVRYEKSTGERVGGKTHTEKAEHAVTFLQRWLSNNQTSSPGDRAAAENVLHDLLDSLGRDKW